MFKDARIVFPKTFDLLQQIQGDPFFDDFFLVGGTALALHIGHRLSIDLDFFSVQAFVNQELESYLVSKFSFQTDYVSKNTLQGFIDGVKIDFITHAYPLVSPLVQENGLRLASLEDIGAMKLNAIARSGNRQKDFYDVYFLLEHLSFNNLLKAYQAKYPSSNPVMALKGIAYFEEIDFEIEKPVLIRRVSFLAVKKRLNEALSQPDFVFTNK